MRIETEPIYRCDICNTQSKWIKGEWIAHIFPVRHDEYEFHLCSDACDEKLLDMTKEQRVKLYKSVRGRESGI